MTMSQPNERLNFNNRELANLLIEYGNNPKNYSPIDWAAHLGHIEVVKKLIDYGVDFRKELRPGAGFSLLSIALDQNHFELAEYFLQQGIRDFDWQVIITKTGNDIRCLELLHKYNLIQKIDTRKLADFIKAGMSISNIRFLLEHGADCRSDLYEIDYVMNRIGRKIFMGSRKVNILAFTATAHEQKGVDPDLIRLLVDYGAPINDNPEIHPKSNAFSILCSAAAGQIKEESVRKWNNLIKYLIERGAKWPSDSDNYTIVSMLKSAYLFNRNIDLIFLIHNNVRSCLEHAFIHSNDGFCTMLQHAVLQNRYADAKRLLEAGANPNRVGTKNCWIEAYKQGICSGSPIRIAIQSKNQQMLELLISYDQSGQSRQKG